MPKYAANITMMWTDIEDPFDRLRAASGAGFSAVERVFVDDIDVVEMHKVLDDLGLQLVLFDPYPGKWDEGDRGMLCIPDRHDEMIETVKAAVEHAHTLGTPQTNVLAGVLQPGQTRADAYDAARRGLERVLEDVDLGGTTILLESVCDDIWNGSLLDTVELA